MGIKQLLPGRLRQVLRPAYQRAMRRWSESRLSPKPAAWSEARQRARSETDFDALLALARSEFGITQVRSEIHALVQLLRENAPATIVEIGTHKGGNSFLFCHALPATRHVVGVDLRVQNSAKLIDFVRPGQRYTALHGNSQTEAMKARVRRALAGRPIDFLFIDGDHGYDGVKADFELYSPLVRPGGIIAFHDIVPDHRTRFGKDTGCYAGEVYRFWAELKQRHRHEELVEDPGQDGFGIGIIHVD